MNRAFSANGLMLCESPGRCPGLTNERRAFGAKQILAAASAFLSRIYSERNHEWTRINMNFRGKIEIFRSTEEGHYLVTRSDTQRLLDFHSCLFVVQIAS
jgi:hypothetical protein